MHNYCLASLNNCTFDSNDAHYEIYKVNGFDTHIPKGGTNIIFFVPSTCSRF